MTEKFDEFLQEVEGDIRQEKLEKLWKKYGKIITISIVVILSISAAYMLWQNHQNKQSNLFSEMFVGAQDLMAQGKFSEALGVMQGLTKSSHPTYPFLAKFQEAYLISQKDYKSAKILYDKIYQDTSLDIHYRDLALIFLANLIIDHLDSHTAEIEILQKDLSLVADSDRPWHYFAQELAGILRYKKGDFEKATELFLKLAQDRQLPEGMRNRVQLMMQHLSSLTIK